MSRPTPKRSVLLPVNEPGVKSSLILKNMPATAGAGAGFEHRGRDVGCRQPDAVRSDDERLAAWAPRAYRTRGPVCSGPTHCRRWDWRWSRRR